MLKKSLVTFALALLASVGALASLPAGPAHADSSPTGPVTVSVTGDANPGGTVIVAFADGSFLGGEKASVTATGVGLPTLGTLRAATNTHRLTVGPTGALRIDVTLPAKATDFYTVIATGLTSGTVGVATIAVAVATAVATLPPTYDESDTPAPIAAKNISVTGASTAGAESTVTFAKESFADAEDVSVAVTGSGTATLASLRAGTVTFIKHADAHGGVSVNVTLPADAAGSYTVTASGITSNLVGTATITVGAAPVATGPTAAGSAPARPGPEAAANWAPALGLGLGLAGVGALSIVLRRRRVAEAAALAEAAARAAAQARPLTDYERARSRSSRLGHDLQATR